MISLYVKKRCIMIFPQFENMSIIDDIREKYDPLANHVRPHVTLVFPFGSTINKEELEDYLKSSLKGIKCFNLVLDKIIKVDDHTGLYLFYGIDEGTESIKEIHNRLYQGMLKSYKPSWLFETEFMPHITIGSFHSREELDNAYRDVNSTKETFRTMVEKISVEIIDENEDSIIEIEINLSR